MALWRRRLSRTCAKSVTMKPRTAWFCVRALHSRKMFGSSPAAIAVSARTRCVMHAWPSCAPCRTQHQADHVRKQGTVHHHEATHRVVLCACTLQPQNVRFISGGHHRAVRAHTRHFRPPRFMTPYASTHFFENFVTPWGVMFRRDLL